MHLIDGIGIGGRNPMGKERDEAHGRENEHADNGDAVTPKASPHIVARFVELCFGHGRERKRRSHYEYFTRGSSHAYVMSPSRLKNTTKNETSMMYAINTAKSN